MIPDNRETQIARQISGAVRNRNIALDPAAAEILSKPATASGIIVPVREQSIVEAKEGKFILFVLDSSVSMSGHQAAVRNGYNEFLDRMSDSPANRRTTLIHTVDIYGNVISPLGFLSDAARLDERNYSPSGGSTPLRDALVSASAQLVHEVQRQFNNYRIVNGILMLLTDGKDNVSKHTIGETRIVVDSVRKTGNNLYIGAGVGERSQYLTIFGEMGIPENFVVSGTNSQDMFRLVGDAAVAVDNPASFRALALRGLPVTRRG